MNKEITCINCAHWNLREAPAMARYGFGACGQGKNPSTTHSGTFPRICLRFSALPAADVQKRVEWFEKRSEK
jgi:hypothetical protein